MFTENFYNLVKWNHKYLSEVEYPNAVSDSALNDILFYDRSKNIYFIKPPYGSSYAAKNYLSHTLAQPFKQLHMFIGYASTEEEFNDYSAHEKGYGFGENQGHYIVGDDKLYEEHFISKAYTNNTASAYTINKFGVQSFIVNYFVSGTGTTSSAVQLNAPMIIDRFDPITMASGETRRFTFKLRFPVFY